RCTWLQRVQRRKGFWATSNHPQSIPPPASPVKKGNRVSVGRERRIAKMLASNFLLKPSKSNDTRAIGRDGPSTKMQNPTPSLLPFGAQRHLAKIDQQ